MAELFADFVTPESSLELTSGSSGLRQHLSE